MTIQPTADEVFRDFVIPGVPASGPYQPPKKDVRTLLAFLETVSNVGAGFAYADRASINADLAHAANTFAIVYGDAVPANNGMYVKSGSSGSGVWTRAGDLPTSLIRLNVTGGTGDAIVATAAETPSMPGAKLYVVTPTANSTGPSAIEINGGVAAPIKTALGSDTVANSLVAGSPVLMTWSVDHYQLMISVPVDASGVLNDVLAARDSTIAYRDAASESAAAAAASAASIGGWALKTSPKTVTADYTVVIDDWGKTIRAGSGSTGLFVISLPDPSTLAEGFFVRVKNGDNGRGKRLSGFPADFGTGSGILWPLQAGTVGIVDGAWTTLESPGLWTTNTFVTFNVDHTLGSDTNNDGLAVGAGAFKTYQNAVDTALRNVYSPKRNIMIKGPAAGETFTENVVITSTIGATSGIYLQGTSANPALSQWRTDGGGGALVVHDNAFVLIDGFKLLALGSNRTGLVAGKFGFIEAFNMEYGGFFPGGIHINIVQGGYFNYGSGSYTVSGSGAYHIAMQGGETNLFGAAVNISTAVTFTAWLYGELGGKLLTTSTYTNPTNVTGKKFDLNGNATVKLNGTVLPGSVAGTTATGGQVV